MRQLCRWLPCLAVLAALGTAAWSAAPAMAGSEAPSASRSAPSPQLAQRRECQQRAGPYATQSTAWQRRNEAQSQGYGVSGVFPCTDSDWTRGYCFNAFFPC